MKKGDVDVVERNTVVFPCALCFCSSPMENVWTPPLSPQILVFCSSWPRSYGLCLCQLATEFSLLCHSLGQACSMRGF